MALYDYQAGVLSLEQIHMRTVLIRHELTLNAHSVLLKSCFLRFISADDDEISFDPDYVIINVEMVSFVRHTQLSYPRL